MSPSPPGLGHGIGRKVTCPEPDVRLCRTVARPPGEAGPATVRRTMDAGHQSHFVAETRASGSREHDYRLSANSSSASSATHAKATPRASGRRRGRRDAGPAASTARAERARQLGAPLAARFPPLGERRGAREGGGLPARREEVRDLGEELGLKLDDRSPRHRDHLPPRAPKNEHVGAREPGARPLDPAAHRRRSVVAFDGEPLDGRDERRIGRGQLGEARRDDLPLSIVARLERLDDEPARGEADRAEVVVERPAPLAQHDRAGEEGRRLVEAFDGGSQRALERLEVLRAGDDDALALLEEHDRIALDREVRPELRQEHSLGGRAVSPGAEVEAGVERLEAVRRPAPQVRERDLLELAGGHAVPRRIDEDVDAVRAVHRDGEREVLGERTMVGDDRAARRSGVRGHHDHVGVAEDELGSNAEVRDERDAELVERLVAADERGGADDPRQDRLARLRRGRGVGPVIPIERDDLRLRVAPHDERAAAFVELRRQPRVRGLHALQNEPLELAPVHGAYGPRAGEGAAGPRRSLSSTGGRVELTSVTVPEDPRTSSSGGAEKDARTSRRARRTERAGRRSARLVEPRPGQPALGPRLCGRPPFGYSFVLGARYNSVAGMRALTPRAGGPR
ncbi:MAG: hypothetical protein KF782_16630 [Labilithrix sp.]|nr:hypothetical protein [Labilithrix sp.]